MWLEEKHIERETGWAMATTTHRWKHCKNVKWKIKLEITNIGLLFQTGVGPYDPRPRDQGGDEIVVKAYYQWVPFFLFLQVPHRLHICPIFKTPFAGTHVLCPSFDLQAGRGGSGEANPWVAQHLCPWQGEEEVRGNWPRRVFCPDHVRERRQRGVGRQDPHQPLLVPNQHHHADLLHQRIPRLRVHKVRSEGKLFSGAGDGSWVQLRI